MPVEYKRKAKRRPNINTNEILERMMAEGGFKSLAELGDTVGLSPQAMGSIKKRGSISLDTLLKYCEKMNLTLDFVIYGKKSDLVMLAPAVSNLLKTAPLAFEASFIEQALSLSKSTAKYFIDEQNRFMIIDTTPLGRQISDGEYLIAVGAKAVTRKCITKITGDIAIQGEGDIPAEKTNMINVIGRVVWSGQSC